MSRHDLARLAAVPAAAALLLAGVVRAQDPPAEKPRADQPRAGQPATAKAGTTAAAEKPSSYSPVVIKEDFATTMKRMSAEKPAIMKRQMDLLAQRYDLGNRPAEGRDDDARQAGAGRRARASCRQGVTWEQLGRDGAGGDPRAKSCSRRASCRCRTPTTPRAGWSSPSSTSTRSSSRRQRDLDALRPRLRPPRPLPAGVPAADLPDHAAGPRRRLAGQARHHRELLRAVQRHPESEAARGPAPAGHAVPAAAVQPDRGPPLARGRAAASPASTATSTATPTAPPTWSATSARRSSATASTRRRCAA